MTIPRFAYWCDFRLAFTDKNYFTETCNEHRGEGHDCRMVEILSWPLDRRMKIFVDWYDVTDVFMRDHGRLEVVDALKGAGISADFWNESHEPDHSRFGMAPSSEWTFVPDKNAPGGLRVIGPEPCYLCHGYVPLHERYQVAMPFAPEGQPKARVGHRSCLA